MAKEESGEEFVDRIKREIADKFDYELITDRLSLFRTAIKNVYDKIPKQRNLILEFFENKIEPRGGFNPVYGIRIFAQCYEKTGPWWWRTETIFFTASEDFTHFDKKIRTTSLEVIVPYGDLTFARQIVSVFKKNEKQILELTGAQSLIVRLKNVRE